jgi:hypothetical protein
MTNAFESILFFNEIQIAIFIRKKENATKTLKH